MIDEVEQQVLDQVQNILDDPQFADTKIAIMPDCHAGAGAVIGYTAELGQYIAPNIVGVDIGCGVLAYNLGQKSINFKRLDKIIRKHVPFGKNVHDKPQIVSPTADDIVKLAKKVASKPQRALCSLGTLGGGNHFIEVGISSVGNHYLIIHSGSRKFGMDVANFHTMKAKAQTKQGIPALHLGKGGQEYLDDMRLAQTYASLNRSLIGEIILDELGRESLGTIESVHNYISFKDNIIRKGAISAHEGEKMIIPLNMRSGCLLATGKGNPNWNYSAPHGAGRVMSRKKAHQSIRLDEFQEQMKGIWSSSINKNTLDEAPDAYKHPSVITSNISETCYLDDDLEVLYNFKADN